MTIVILLIVDFILLGIVAAYYFRRRFQEKAAMAGVTCRSQDVQQRMYQV